MSPVAGDKLRLQVAPKGFGSENMSALKMLKPADGVQGIKDFVVKAVSEAGGNPCPPIIIRVVLVVPWKRLHFWRRGLSCEVGSRHPKPHVARLEETVGVGNKTGVGPQGFGGTQTALELFVEVYPTHGRAALWRSTSTAMWRHGEAVL